MASVPPSESQLEIPIFGPDSGILASSAGARRLELNRAGSYALGGTTPTLSELSLLITSLSVSPLHTTIPLRIMIRPRGAPSPTTTTTQTDPDFLYSPSEIATMRQDIISFKDSGLLDAQRGDGFVFGLLTLFGDDEHSGVSIDVEGNRELVELAKPFMCVFHRAFDDVLGACGANSGDEGGGEEKGEKGEKGAVEDVVRCGFDGVLSSGGPGDVGVPRNAERLGRVVRGFGGRVEVVVGGGVRSGNVKGLAGRLGEGCDGVWFHSSCLAAIGGEKRFDTGEAGRLVRELGLLRGGTRVGHMQPIASDTPVFFPPRA